MRIGLAVAALLGALATAPAFATEVVAERKVLDGIAKQLANLERAGDAEERRSPQRPARSRQTAYRLLVDYADNRAAEPIDAETVRTLAPVNVKSPFVSGTGREKATIVRVNGGVWIVFTEVTIQDKSGSYIEKHALLFANRGGAWKRLGWGAIAERVPS